MRGEAGYETEGRRQAAPSLSCADHREARDTASLQQRPQDPTARDRWSPELQSPVQSEEERGGKELTLDSCC